MCKNSVQVCVAWGCAGGRSGAWLGASEWEKSVCLCVWCIKACLSGYALEIKVCGGNVWTELLGLTAENRALFFQFSLNTDTHPLAAELRKVL